MSNEYWLTNHRFKKAQKLLVFTLLYSIASFFAPSDSVNIIQHPFFVIFITSIFSIFIIQKHPVTAVLSLGIILLQLLSLFPHTGYSKFSIGLILSIAFTVIALILVVRGLIAQMKFKFKKKIDSLEKKNNP